MWEQTVFAENGGDPRTWAETDQGGDNTLDHYTTKKDVYCEPVAA